MNIKLIVSALIVFSMIATSFAVIGPQGFSDLSTSKVASEIIGSSEVNIFAGNVTIYHNGSLSMPGAPISVSGHTYTLSGDITGSLKVEASNSTLNGNGYTISGNHGILPSLTVSNSSGVSVSDLTVTSGNNTSIAVMFFNTSMDQLTDVNISAAFQGIEVSNYTSAINISDSRVTVGKGSLVDGGDILTCAYMGPENIIGMGNHSDNITIYNDVLANNGGSYGVLINSPNSSLKDSSISMVGKSSNSGKPAIFLSLQNYTTVANNSIYGRNVSLGVGFSSAEFGIINSTGDQFNGNSLTIVSPSGSYFGVSSILAFSASLSMKDNKIYALNFPADDSIAGMLFGNFSVTENSIQVVNSSNSAAIEVCALNSSIDSNSIAYSQNSSMTANSAIAVGSSNFNVNNNSITVNNTGTSSIISVNQIENSSKLKSISNNGIVSMNTSAMGIQFHGSNTTISGNRISMNGKEPNGIVFSGTGISVSNNMVNVNSSISSTGIGDFNEGSGVYNSTISGNMVNITGNATGQLFGMLFEYAVRNLTLRSNYITSTGAKFDGMLFSGDSNSNISISRNSIVYDYKSLGLFKGLGISNFNNTLINGNNIVSRGYAGLGTNSYALSLGFLYNLVVSNNTVEGVNTSLSMGIATNVTVYGNYFLNQYTALDIGLLLNTTFYHNNFENFTVAAEISGTYNVSFNASYPVGGNYWSNYTGVDRNHGPSQNIPGSDGIGDTPYYLNATLKDNYPLMKPWTRPEAVFRASGLLPDQAWSVTFNGKTITSKEDVISFAILNGTYQNYSYSIGTLAGYRGGGQSGEMDYTGNGFMENVTYAHKFNVTFRETGLPSGTQWAFKLNGTVINVTASSYTLSAYKGTSFSYSVDNLQLYYSNVSSGSFTLSGNNITVSIEYLHFSYIHGILSPSETSIIINGVNYGMYNGSYNISLEAGSYVVEFEHSGYKNAYANVSLNAGEVYSANISLVSAGKPGSSLIYIGAAAGAIVVAAALGSYFVLRRSRK